MFSASLAATDTRTLVAFSQNDPAVRRELARVLVELVSRLSDDWRVVLKPHPREPDASTYYRDLRESGVEVLPHTEDSYSLLASSHVSLAVYSTVAIEALAFGCRSLVLRSPLWPEDIRTFVEQGQLIPVDGAEAVARECSAEWTPGAHEALASDLFGIGHPAPDFAELIRRASVVRD